MSENEAEIELDEAIARLGLETRLAKVPCDAAQEFVAALRVPFVAGNPRVLWMGLGPQARSAPYGSKDEWFACLLAACASVGATAGVLVLETDTDRYPVYRCSDVNAIRCALSECAFFEYYFVDEHLRWFIADTEHNEILTVTRHP